MNNKNHYIIPIIPDLFTIFINLLLSILIVLVLQKLLNFKCCPYKLALLIVVIFLLSYYFVLTEERMNSKSFFQNIKSGFTINKSHNNIYNNYPIPNLDVADETFTKSVEDYYGTFMPIMGPLDGLPWDEVVRRVNYLKVKSQYPYRPMKYTDFKTSMDDIIGQDLSGLNQYTNLNTPEIKQELGRWYPDSTLNQINARDCTNYVEGHPFSCVQKPTKLSDDLLDKQSKYKEEFMSSGVSNSTQKLLQHETTMPTIFKNAPGSGPNINELIVDISKDKCRGCIVGICSKGVCGSRLIEPGNENILDVEGYVKSYLVDGIAPSSNNLKNNDVDPWTFF